MVSLNDFFNFTVVGKHTYITILIFCFQYLIKEEGQGIALLAFLLRAWNLAAPQRFTGMMDMLATLEELTLKGQLVKLYTGINLNRYLGVQDVDFCYNLNDQKRIQVNLRIIQEEKIVSVWKAMGTRVSFPYLSLYSLTFL